MTTPTTIALLCTSDTLLHTTQQLADQYQLPISTHNDTTYDYLLVIEPWTTTPGYLCKLQQTGAKAPGAVFVDFCSGKAAHRRQFGGGRKQTLARAVGIKPGFNPAILDLTGGLGRDAFVLASLGCHVNLVERQPAIYLLLENGIERARHDADVAAIASNMSPHFADATDLLKRLHDRIKTDVIYLDPMYPTRGKSALIKKEMRYFHDIAGKDEDAATLLPLAMHYQCKRVVVKRPLSAAPLANIKPDTIITSKNTRYDIYLHN